jgi:hypothetical protein
MAYLIIISLCVMLIITKMKWFIGIGLTSYVLLVLIGVI